MNKETQRLRPSHNHSLKIFLIMETRYSFRDRNVDFSRLMQSSSSIPFHWPVHTVSLLLNRRRSTTRYLKYSKAKNKTKMIRYLKNHIPFTINIDKDNVTHTYFRIIITIIKSNETNPKISVQADLSSENRMCSLKTEQ